MRSSIQQPQLVAKQKATKLAQTQAPPSEKVLEIGLLPELLEKEM